MLEFLFFKIRYYLYVTITKIFTPKRNKFIIFFIGGYPQNFKHGFKAVLDANSMFRYSIGSACIVIRFDTKKNILEVRQILNNVYYGHMYSFFIFNEKNIHAKVLDQVHYKNLYDQQIQVKTPEQSLNTIQDFIVVLEQMRSNFIKLIDQNQQMTETPIDERVSEKITMTDINPILEKIKQFGIDSLTENERLILEKYTSND
jgi:hypothetical protein